MDAGDEGEGIPFADRLARIAQTWRAMAPGLVAMLATLAFGLPWARDAVGAHAWAAIALAAGLVGINLLGYAELAARRPGAGAAPHRR